MSDVFGGGDEYIRYDNFFVRKDLAVKMLKLAARDQRFLMKAYEIALEDYVQKRKKSLEEGKDADDESD